MISILIPLNNKIYLFFHLEAQPRSSRASAVPRQGHLEVSWRAKAHLRKELTQQTQNPEKAPDSSRTKPWASVHCLKSGCEEYLS